MICIRIYSIVSPASPAVQTGLVDASVSGDAEPMNEQVNEGPVVSTRSEVFCKCIQIHNYNSE